VIVDPRHVTSTVVGRGTGSTVTPGRSRTDGSTPSTTTPSTVTPVGESRTDELKTEFVACVLTGALMSFGSSTHSSSKVTPTPLSRRTTAYTSPASSTAG
jgi:hypothetical protein